tara:strand:- start:14045 stop:15811 length:1767 start_codon:yes stop_codon:yes gene_type:complete
MKSKLIEFKNLITEFHVDGEITRAVNNISFEVNKGEIVGVVGESGSGKSVTSLSAMRLIPSPPGIIKSGEILYHKNNKIIDLLKLPEKEMQNYRGNNIAMIFQEPMTSLNPVFTCGYQVMEAIMLHQKMNKEEAKSLTIKLFEEVLLPRPSNIFDSYPHQLSGGQKQRVMIAMAISCQPELLIADEPTTALDVTVQKTILELLIKLQKNRGMGIIFITHDLGVIAELADKVIVMFKGKIVEQGSVGEIFKNPKHPYTKGLLACRPPLDNRYKFLPTIKDFMSQDENDNLIEKEKSVSSFIKKIIIKKEERKDSLKKIYNNNILLDVKNLKTYFPIAGAGFGKTKSYVKAVDDVSFNVFKGETLGLVGESGCGKTTIGRSILRLINPTAGEVFYKGQNISKLHDKEFNSLRKEMQIIFQDPYSSLNPRITIGEAIMEPMTVHKLFRSKKERKEKVLELLKKVGLKEDFYFRYPHEFSGGQRQRVGIARALALSPKFIICDESVSALDVSVQAQVLNLLNDLKKEFNLTYIFISHDLSVVKYMSDRMVVMNNGEIVEQGDSDEIYYNPKKKYTQKLISAIPKGDIGKIKK